MKRDIKRIVREAKKRANERCWAKLAEHFKENNKNFRKMCE